MRISDEQRRARIGRRHALAPAHRVGSVAEVVEAMTCLHATEAVTPYLSVAARSDATRADVDRAVYDERSVVKQLAMRRTVFVFPRDLLPAVWGSAAARVAAQQAARVAKDAVGGGLTDDGPAWVREQVAAILAACAQEPRSSVELRKLVPELDRRITLAPGKSYGQEVAIASRTITAVAATGDLLRGENAGTWRSVRPRWTLAADWLGEKPEPLPEDEAYRVVVGRWLRTFGPGTEDDIVWWLGATKAAVRRALAALEAVEVETSSGTSYVLPGDEGPDPEPEPWAALLPVLDATVMGWKQRDFYLGPHAGELFDRQGNAGTTAWWRGRIVGGWHQDPDGVVVVDLLEDVDAEAERALVNEGERLTHWLAGEVIGSVYHSPLTRRQLRAH